MVGRRRGSQSNGMLLMLALHGASQFLQLDRKPPVTVSLIVANVLVYLRPGTLDEVLPSLGEVCLNPYLILRDFDLRRLLLSAFYHVDEAHLVYNMLSLMWKGVRLESSMGSRKFASMVAILLGTSHGLMVLLSKLVSVLTDTPVYSECAVGFSAVLFALKVVLNHNSPANTIVYGVVVPARYAAWAELLLVQMFVPGTSFLGHLSGILAGLLYVHAPRLFSPRRGGFISLLSSLGRCSWMFVTSPFRYLLGWPSNPSPRAPRYGGGFVGSSSRGRGREDTSDGPSYRNWRCSACTFDNWEPSDTCDMCRTPRSSGSNSSGPSAPPWPPQEHIPPPSVEELRRARLARFSR